MGLLFNNSSGGATGGASDFTIAPCIMGPMPGNELPLHIDQGATLRWKLCFCENDVDTVQSFEPATNEIILNEKGCYAAGDCIKIFCHEDQCEDDLLNGEHTITAIDATGLRLTIDTLMGFEDSQSFASLPAIPNCTSDPIVPPRLCKLRELDNIQFSGCITSRLPSQDTRLAMGSVTTQSSDIVRLQELDQVVPGDVVNIPDSGVEGAVVLRVWREQGCDFIRISKTASKSGCFALNSEVGTVANLQFKVDPAASCGCVQVYLTSDQTAEIPLLGDPEKIYRTAQEKGAGGRSKSRKEECGVQYSVGIYSIFAKYVDADLDVESELIARGCVLLHPTNNNKQAFL
jgi:hypothetical protein